MPNRDAAFFVWSLKRLCRMIEKMQDEKFDCNVIIEGARGLGKSTLMFHLLNGVKKYHNFNPRRDIMYKRDEIIDAFNNRWFSSFAADEMINVAFNRDFYSEDQKKLVKIVNMNRDHCNLFIACVPNFQTIDTQMKGLVKMRFTVVRRGVAILQTPNRTIYASDKWDTAINEKIEREWLEKNAARPHYSRLTTFRGVVRFPDLTPNQRAIYEEIKLEKRNQIKRETEAEKKTSNPYDRMLNLVKEGRITSKKLFEQACMTLDVKPSNAMGALRKRLQDEGSVKKLTDYFVDDYVMAKNGSLIKIN